MVDIKSGLQLVRRWCTAMRVTEYRNFTACIQVPDINVIYSHSHRVLQAVRIYVSVSFAACKYIDRVGSRQRWRSHRSGMIPRMLCTYYTAVPTFSEGLIGDPHLGR